MREILFRGKRVDNGEWVEGSLVQFSEGYCLILVPESVDTTALKAESISYPADPKKIGQFTGLTDKNGKKIFEGDIIHYSCSDVTAIVCFGIYYDSDSKKKATGFYVQWSEDGIVQQDPVSDIERDKQYGGEVIGNIYDNPELLEVEE